MYYYSTSKKIEVVELFGTKASPMLRAYEAYLSAAPFKGSL